MKTSFFNLLFFILLSGYYNASAQSWTNLTPSGSYPVLANASAIYDTRADRIVVWGGSGTSGFSDKMWVLNINTNSWSEIIPKTNKKPSARYTHVAMFDSLQNQLIMFSGQGSALYNDVWAFNFSDSTWTELFNDGNISGAPLKRYGNATVFNPQTRKLINFAGFTTSGRFDDTWAFDVDAKSWSDQTTATHPLKRCLTSQCFAKDRGEMIVYAGQSTGNLDDIWSLNTSTYVWSNITPTIRPSSRHFPAIEYIGNSTLLLFGGNGSGPMYDMWKFNLNTQKWDSINQGSNRPAKRYGHSLVYVPNQNKLFLIGGIGVSNVKYNDVWVYNVLLSSVSNNIVKAEDVLIYPNPLTDQLFIDLNSESNNIENVKIIGVTGKLIYEENTVSSNIQLNKLNQFPAGNYIVTIKFTNGNIITKKIIKQ